MRGLTRVLIAGLLLLGCASEDTTTAETFGTDSEEPEPDETTTTEEEPDEPDDTSTTEERSTTTGGGSNDPTATDSGFSTYSAFDGAETWATAGAIINNPSSEDFAFVEVVFNLKAGDKPVATETTYLNLLPADSEVYAAVTIAQDLATAPDSVEVSVVTDDFLDPDDYFVIPVTVTDVVRDQFGLLSVTGTATNPTDEVVELGQVSCVLLSGSTIVGGLVTYLDTMSPGAEIAWEGSDTLDNVTVDDAKCSGDASRS